MITNAKKMIPNTKVIIEITFSGPRSLMFWNNPKSEEPVNADKPSDLPFCNSETNISNTDTINNTIFIVLPLRTQP